MQFVVVVSHNTGHGVCETLVLVTDDQKHAVEVSRSVEALGYEFLNEDAHVSVYRPKPGRVHAKAEYEFNIMGGPSQDYPVLLYRRKADGRWTEEWFDATAEKRHAIAVRVP
jgi:hypothetical protein